MTKYVSVSGIFIELVEAIRLWRETVLKEEKYYGMKYSYDHYFSISSSIPLIRYSYTKWNLNRDLFLIYPFYYYHCGKEMERRRNVIM